MMIFQQVNKISLYSSAMGNKNYFKSNKVSRDSQKSHWTNSCWKMSSNVNLIKNLRSQNMLDPILDPNCYDIDFFLRVSI